MADQLDKILDGKLINNLEKINGLIILTAKNIDSKLIPAIDSLQNSQSGLGKSTKENKDERKKLTEIEKEAQRIESQLEKTEAKIQNLGTEQNKLLEERKRKYQNANKALKNTLILEDKQAGTLEKLRAEIQANTAKNAQQSDHQTHRTTKRPPTCAGLVFFLNRICVNLIARNIIKKC